MGKKSSDSEVGMKERRIMTKTKPKKLKTRKTPYWWKVINRAIKNEEEFTEVEKLRSSVWISCACGEQDDRIPRSREGEPLDKTLQSFGLDFYDAVGMNDPKEAMNVLIKIEHRAAIVIAKNQKKGTK